MVFGSNVRKAASIATAALSSYYGRKKGGGISKPRGKTGTKMAVKYKSGSKTRTKTKPKRKSGSVSAIPGMGSTNFNVVLKKSIPKHERGVWKYSQTNTLSASLGAGLQAFDEVTALGTISQLNISTGVGYNANEGQVALKLLNPNYLNTGSAYLPGASVPTTDEWVIASMKSVCEFTSWCDVAQEVNLYYFVCKTGTQDSPKAVWERGYQQQGSGIGVMTQLVSPLFQGTAGYGKVNEPFATPWDVKRYLSQVWKVVKHTKIMLESGATHTITVNFKTNKKIKQSTLDQAGLDGEVAIPGLTVWMVATVRGQVVKDNTAGTKPTYSSTSMGYICRNSYVCHPVNATANRETDIHSYNVPTGTAFANQLIIDNQDDTDIFKQT